MLVGLKGSVRSLLGGVAALSAVAALGAVAAPAADAASYDVWTCRGPSGEPLPTTGWTLTTRNTSSPADVLLEDTCAAGGALTLSLDGSRALEGQPRGTLTFAPPAGGEIVDYTLQRMLYAPGSGPGFVYSFSAGVTERTPSGETTSGCASALSPPNWNCSLDGSFTDPAAPANRLDSGSGLALDGLQLEVACMVARCNEPFANRPVMVKLYGARIALEDSLAPDAPQLSGTLTEGEAVDRRGTLVVESADDGGGISAMTMALDGGAPETIAPAGPRGTCREPYAVAQPCPSAAARLFTLDASALAEGPHTVSGTVADAAGNVTPYGPVAFEVAHAPAPGDDGGRDPDDGGTPPPAVIAPPPLTPPAAVPVPAPTPPAGNGVPAVKRPRLTLDRREVVRGGSGATRLTGMLRTAGGQPIAGARLTAAARELGTAAERARPLPAVTTAADGRFAVTVAGSGAQRVELAFAPSADAADTARATAVVRVAARLTATRSRARLRRGEAIVIAGRLDGAGGAARGAVVELQAIVRGEWRTVGTVHTGAGGRYRWRYRFVNVTRDTIFSFRALVRATPGWPWPELTTRRVQVRVDAN